MAVIGNPLEKQGLATNSTTTRNDIGVGTSTLTANSVSVIETGAAPQKSPA